MLTHKGTSIIETSRLILRRAVREDVLLMFHNWASDSEVTKYLSWPTHSHTEASQWVIEEWIREYEKEDFYQWMIVLKELGEPVGSISVVSIHDSAEEAEVGYCIGREWWHRGITSEALAAVIAFLFTQVGMTRVSARHDINNPHSGGVMKKCGMIYQGMKPKSDRNNQGVCDTAHYAIDRSTWYGKDRK